MPQESCILRNSNIIKNVKCSKSTPSKVNGYNYRGSNSIFASLFRMVELLQERICSSSKFFPLRVDPFQELPHPGK